MLTRKGRILPTQGRLLRIDAGDMFQRGAELEVSQRSVYRDIADLMGQRVPIRGEAGVCYVIDRDFGMPPLMLTPDELEAAVLGALWVGARPKANRHRKRANGFALVGSNFALVYNYRTLTLGSTDMPGPISTSGWWSNVIFVGMRWTTFT